MLSPEILVQVDKLSIADQQIVQPLLNEYASLFNSSNLGHTGRFEHKNQLLDEHPAKQMFRDM